MSNFEQSAYELSVEELESVQGGIGVIELSSAAGHLGRAFGVGYAIGEGINYAFERFTGNSIGGAIYDMVNGGGGGGGGGAAYRMVCAY